MSFCYIIIIMYAKVCFFTLFTTKLAKKVSLGHKNKTFWFQIVVFSLFFLLNGFVFVPLYHNQH